MIGQVTIRSMDRKWKKEVMIDDELFSDILAPYIELEVPTKEVVLSETLSTIFKEEWVHIERLLRMMDERRDSIKCVSLRSIRRLSRILNLPDGWHVYVSVSRDDEEYLNHLTTSSLIHRELYAMDGPVMGLVGAVLNADHKLFNPLMTVTMNSYRLCSQLGMRVDTSRVDWDAMISLIGRLDIHTTPEVINTLNTLAGRGSVSDRVIVPDAMELNSLQMRGLYNVLMKSLPDDVDPSVLNISCELRDYDWPFDNDLMNIIPYVNARIIILAKREESIDKLHRIASSTRRLWSPEMANALEEDSMRYHPAIQPTLPDLSWGDELLEHFKVVMNEESMDKLLTILHNAIEREGADANDEWARAASVIRSRRV